jgi:flavin reductase (DIM6/NTAB) family NADH-FMN oxidoreductase RutF
MSFFKINVADLTENPIKMIRDRWPLLGAGDIENHNFMTVNWGMIGEIWKKDSITAYVRHSRHTFKYMEENDYFILSVLKAGHEKALSIAGSKSGRDIDKVIETGLTPVEVEHGVTFEEAEYVFVLKKLYALDMPLENFVTKEIVAVDYPTGDLHRMYIGSIEAVYQNK